MSSLLLGLLKLNLLAALLQHSLSLQAHNSTAPLALDGFIELSMEVLRESLQLGFIILVDLGKSNDGSVLLVGEGAESALALDNGEWDIHLAAQGWQPDDKLNWVNIVSDDDQLGLLLLDQRGDVLQAVLQSSRSLGGGNWLTLGNGSSLSFKSGSLGILGLWLVLNQKLEELSGLVLVQSSLELVDGWWDLQALNKDLLLSLKSDILWPTDISGQVTGGSDVTSNTEGLGAGLEERRWLGTNLLGLSRSSLGRGSLGRSLGGGSLWWLWGQRENR